MSDDRDSGPPERYRKGDNIIPFQVIEQVKQSIGYKAKAGDIVMLNQSECSLDIMYHRGHLGGHQEAAKKRYDAGMWLRETYLRLHASVGVAAYHDAWSRFQDISSNLSDVNAWNMKCLAETRHFMGSHWRPLDCVCIMDRKYAEPWPKLQEALDILAEYRGL